MLNNLKSEIQALNNTEKAIIYSKFFKTKKGEYGEGDLFLGLTMPQQRILAKKYHAISLQELQELLQSKFHEHRMTALVILVNKYEKSNLENKEEIFNFYLKNTKNINNWDLVDVTCHKIIGDYLLDKKRSVLYRLAKSNNLWEKRIAVVSTFRFIKENQFEDTLNISELLINNKHDLIHKAVGWMLREVGKKDQKIEENFLKKHYKEMPRTMLRYAIERFDKTKRDYYMAKD